jgi:putative ABC transport system ATP-binding protein
VLDLLLDLHRGGATIMLVTHDRAIAAQTPRRIELRDGHVVGDGRTPTSAAA